MGQDLVSVFPSLEVVKRGSEGWEDEPIGSVSRPWRFVLPRAERVDRERAFLGCAG